MEENENFIQNKYGYCYYSFEADNTAIIFNLYVDSECRRKGHAKHLLSLIMKEIREAGYSGKIQIEAEPQEDSISLKDLIAFYEQMGLKVINS